MYPKNWDVSESLRRYRFIKRRWNSQRYFKRNGLQMRRFQVTLWTLRGGSFSSRSSCWGRASTDPAVWTWNAGPEEREGTMHIYSRRRPATLLGQLLLIFTQTLKSAKIGCFWSLSSWHAHILQGRCSQSPVPMENEGFLSAIPPPHWEFQLVLGLGGGRGEGRWVAKK